MVYDDDTSRRVHLPLPLESLEEMAARVTEPVPSFLTEAITRAVQQHTARRLRTSPSRIKSDLWRVGIEVTVEQVALVMTRMMAPEPPATGLDSVDLSLLRAAFEGRIGRDQLNSEGGRLVVDTPAGPVWPQAKDWDRSRREYLWIQDGSVVVDDVSAARLDKLIEGGWLDYDRERPFSCVETTPKAWPVMP